MNIRTPTRRGGGGGGAGHLHRANTRKRLRKEQPLGAAVGRRMRADLRSRHATHVGRSSRWRTLHHAQAATAAYTAPSVVGQRVARGFFLGLIGNTRCTGVVVLLLHGLVRLDHLDDKRALRDLDGREFALGIQGSKAVAPESNQCNADQQEQVDRQSTEQCYT
jgi:hypothetical protein